MPEKGGTGVAKGLSEAIPGWEHPIRIPTSIELTHADPPYAIAGERSTWRLPFRLARDVSPGEILKLQLWGGRNNRWSFVGAQAGEPGEDGYVAAELADGTRLALRSDDKEGTFAVDLPEGGLARDTVITVTVGDTSGEGRGILAQEESILNKFFVLYSQSPDRRDDGLAEDAGAGAMSAGALVWAEKTEGMIVAACTMHVLGGGIDHLRAYVPSQTRLGEPMCVLVRPQDGRCNLATERVRAPAIFLGDDELDARIEPVPDSTCIRAYVALPEEGTHRLRVLDRASGTEAVANPTVCSASTPSCRMYWGMIHGHTEMSDGTGSIEHYLRQTRDEAGLDFAAPGDHDHLWETSDVMWEATCEAVKRWNAPEEFVTLLGYEWAKWRRNGDGDRNVYYLHDDRPMYRSDEGEYPSPPVLFGALRDRGERAIVIPHHTGHWGNFCDWKDHEPEYERLVEIFQCRGSFETSEEDGNPVPERGPQPTVPEGYVSRALAMGWRVGFTAGGDDHQGHAGTDFPLPDGGADYKAGLTCVQADALTRKAIWDALWSRRVVATTGARILLTYDLAGHPMGSELSVRDVPELAERRRIGGNFHGTAGVDRIDIIRNNKVVHCVPGDGKMDGAFVWEDVLPLEDIRMPAARFCDHPFTFYYVRLVQSDGEVAWASPVWID